MVRHFLWLVIAVVVAIVLSPRVFGQEAGAAGAAGNGFRLFMETGCAVCHGADGRGGAAGPRIAANELTQSEFIAAVRLPMRTMPAFPEQALSDQGLIQMYDYFQAQGAPSAAAGRAGVGAESYSAYGCYSCHANEAQGGMHGPRLGPDPISFARFAWYIRHPSRTMPPYSTTVLTDRDIADIYAFVEAQPEPPPLSSIPLLAP